MAAPPNTVEVFISYSSRDEELQNELEKYLANLEQEGLITIWSDSKLISGDEWETEIQTHLNAARIILLLISPDYLRSDWTYSIEMQRTLGKHNAGQAHIIPIILRASDWQNTPFARLLALPSHGRPVIEWPDREEAYTDIIRGIRKAVQDLLTEEQFKEPNSDPSSTSVTPDDQKQAPLINGNGTSNTPDPDSKVGADQTTELDEEALFRRLSPSSRQALNQADGIRTALGQRKVHMEHLIAGLLAKKGGPTEELLGKANIDVTTLGTVVETSFPREGSYKSSELTTLPQMSDHVRKALIAARDVAGSQASSPVRTRHLLYGVLSIADCHVIQALLARGIHKENINLFAPPSRSKTPSHFVISGYTSDDPKGQDLLGIKKEVEALCSVLVANDVDPPLSLGLFGDWGSGKSFFMRMMQERIEILKEAAKRTQGKTAYCKNIVQLKFNAWSYIDTDLWASLTSEIFEGLSSALVKKDSTELEHTHARLLADAASVRSKDMLAEAEEERNEASAKLQESEQSLRMLEKDESSLTRQAILIGSLNVAIRQPEVREMVGQLDKELNMKLDEAEKKLNNSTLNAMKTEVLARGLKVDGIRGRLQALAIALRNSRGQRTLLLTAGVAIIMIVLVWMLIIYRGLLAGILTLPVAILAAFAPFIAVTWRTVSIFMQVQAERTRIFDETRKRKQDTLQKEVAKAQVRVEQAQQRVKQARDDVMKTEKTVEALHADPQISDFIKQRQASTDYTRYLGVIARARDDFEKLSILLAKEKADAEEEKRTPDVQEKRLLPPIDRIILYIDDLDRCPEKSVVEVLQAVHLLLAFPLFIVVVGVDSRWLMHSLKQHSKAFQSESDGIPGEELAQWQSTPLNYMEKIFQIPFTLRPMQAAGFGQLVDALTSQPKNTHSAKPDSEQITTGETSDSSKEIAQQDDVSNQHVSTPESSGQRPMPSPSPLETALVDSTPSVNALPQKDIDLNPGYLLIEDWERMVMKKLYQFIPSPRAAKRFVNVYRLLRASIDEHKLQAFIGDKNGGQHRSMLLLLAMLIGYPAETTEIFLVLLERKHTETWWNFIDSFKMRVDSSISSTNSATLHNVSEAEAERWRQLLEKLTEVRTLIREDQSCADFVECAPQIARYSYESRPILFAQ